MTVKHIETPEEWRQALKDAGDKLTVVDFYATWCGPCRVLAPKLEELSAQFKNAKFYSIDVDALQKLAEEYGITAMPTILFFKGGKEVGKVVGANLPQIQNLLAQHAS